jgi:hypothetical protein
MIKLVGLYSSAPQSGKSTVANMLKNEYKFEIISFSSPLKYINVYILVEMGYTHREAVRLAYKDKEEIIPELQKSSRHIQQTLGTNWGRRMINENIYVNIALRKIEKNKLYVIDDVRNPNEAMAVRQAGGEIWQIKRNTVVYNGTHPSEGLLDSIVFDRIIENNSTISCLNSRISSIFAI